MKKRIMALVLCASLLYGISAGAVEKNVREAGVADNLSENRRFSKKNSIIWDEGGVFAAQVPANIVYSLYKGISYAFVVAENGTLNESFTLELSSDGENFSKKLSVPTEVGSKDGINVYYFNEIGNEENILRINLLDTNVKIRGVYINTDLVDIELRKLVKLTEETVESGFSDRTITDEDLQTYKNTYRKLYTQSKQDVSTYVDAVEADGTWDDVKYVGSAAGDNAETHLLRCTEIAKSVSTEGSSLYLDENTLEKLALACNAMCDMNIKMESWYNNQLTIMKNVGIILLSAGDLLPEKTQAKLKEYMDSRISLSYSQPPSVYTGANLIERQDAIVRYALYLNDTKLLKDALDPIINEMVMVTKINANENPGRVVSINGYSGFSGIQADYSLWFHGPQLYSCGYCLTMFKTIVQFIYDTQGTNIFPVETTKDFIDCIFEHYLWIMRGTTVDFNTIGRTIAMASSSCASGNANSVIAMITKLSTIDGIYRQDELIALNNMINAKDDGSVGSSGAYIITNVSASSAESSDNNSMNMLDDDYDTRWSAEGTEQYAIFDLGQIQNVGVVSVALYSGMTRQTDFEIDLSTDGESWSTVFDGMSSGTTDAPEYYTFFPREAQFVRLRCHGNTKTLWNSITEVEVYESIDVGGEESEYELLREAGGAKIYITRPVDKVARAYVHGNKYFWRSNYMISQQPNLMIALKMSSKKIIANEQISMLNLKGTYKSDGCTMLYRTTQEYDDIFGAWDWKKLPGTTTSLKDFNPPLVQDYRASGSMSEYVGGVTNGKQGAAAMELVRDGISAKKSWFIFDDEMLAMGTDLKNTTNSEMVTTMNQCLLKSDVVVSGGGVEKTLSRGMHKNQKVDWVLQDKIGYLFPEGATVNIENDAKTGDRIDINWSAQYTRPNKTDLVTKDIFSLWVNHSDKAAGEQDGYCYMVIPQVTNTRMNEYMADNPVKILSNTNLLQAAEHRTLGITQSIFWEPGSVTDSDGIEITVERPLLVQVKKSDEKLIVNVSGLTFEAGETVVTINEMLEGEGIRATDGKSEFTVKLPGGEYTGNTVSFEFMRTASVGD